VLQDYTGVDAGVVAIIKLYTAALPTLPGAGAVTTLGDLLRALLQLCNDDVRAAAVRCPRPTPSSRSLPSLSLFHICTHTHTHTHTHLKQFMSQAKSKYKP
jgi:hypothetical protein